jgi:hypothetical protein
MDSLKKDRGGQGTDEGKEPVKADSHDIEWDDEWDEWYDDNENQNKKFKIRRRNKRLVKQRDEW